MSDLQSLVKFFLDSGYNRDEALATARDELQQQRAFQLQMTKATATPDLEELRRALLPREIMGVSTDFAQNLESINKLSKARDCWADLFSDNTLNRKPFVTWSIPQHLTFPPPGAKDVQPFVTACLENIFMVRTSPEDPTLVPRSGPFFRSSNFALQYDVDLEAFKHVSFSNRKPDNVFYVPGQRGEMSIVLIGDNKERIGEGDFSDACRGHVLDMARELMLVQTMRTFLFCFLTDGYRMQFFRIRRVAAEDFEYDQSPVYIENKGWRILLWMLFQDHAFHGFEAVRVDDWVATRFLGRGGQCTAFECRRNDGTLAVLKMFRNEGDRNNERENFTVLQQQPDVARFVPRVELCPPGSYRYGNNDVFVLVVTPVGSPVRPCVDRGECLQPRHFVALVNILEVVHKDLRIIHRDIKPANLYLHGDDILLNDWGIACPEGNTTWKGTVGFSDFRTAGQEYHHPTAATDLRALVRTMYTALYKIAPPIDSFDNADKFWRDAFRLDQEAPCPTIWKEMIDAASQHSYDVLKNLIWRL